MARREKQLVTVATLADAEAVNLLRRAAAKLDVPLNKVIGSAVWEFIEKYKLERL